MMLGDRGGEADGTCGMINQTLFGCGLALWLAAWAAPAAQPARMGPIENPGMTVVADPNGAQAPGYRFENPGAKPAPWQARWIWVAGDAPDIGWLRREVALADAPKNVTAWISADMKYRLWINGRLAARGPVDMGADYAGGSTHRWFYDRRDLTPFFQAGRNVIAVEVFRQWPIGFTVTRGHPGFLFEAQADGQTVKSDATWRAIPAGAAPDWQAPDFADAAWPRAREVDDVWQPLIPSEIPPLMEAVYPVDRFAGLKDRTVRQDGEFQVVFNRVLSAYPFVKVKGGRGATLTLKARHEYSFQLGGGETACELPFMTEVAPAFTVALKNVTEPVEVLDAGAVFTSQPVAYRGAFACDDARLNRIWDASRWAVQICLQTHHLDSPNHQEPISDPGDYLIESMVNYYAFAQPWLARQDTRKFAWLLKDEQYRNFHISYSIGWLQMLMDYYDYTGDRALVVEMAPYAHELLAAYTAWRGANGLISEAPNYMFMDWVTIGGFECHHPPAVIGQGYLTAFYYHGLALAARIAELTGDAARAAQYAQWRRETAAAFNRELWVGAKGLYRDGKPFVTSVKPHQWLPADKAIETFSPHVNLLAVLYDLAPPEKHRGIVVRVMADQPLNTQPWFMHWVFQAIDHAGMFERYATPQMRRWQIVPATQSFREMWHGGDLSHGWCSTPLVQMSARVLGVTPAAPGFKIIALRPRLCDLSWAQGSVPTPLGDVPVAWRVEAGKFYLDFTVPDGAEADVVLPVERFERPSATLDGRRVGARFRASPGARHVILTGKPRPLATQRVEAAAAVLDARVVKEDLLRRQMASAADHCAHAGGGSNPDALFNGTTGNGSGTGETLDDGQTFRGYGAGDWLVIRLKQPCDLREIRTFARHQDKRAGQNYDVLAAYAAEPDQFVKLATGVKPGEGALTELSLPVTAPGVVALRFEFQDGPQGFNVYREINVLGKPSNK